MSHLQFEDQQSELETVTDPQVLQDRMRECVGFVCRQMGKVIRADVGSVAFESALEGASMGICAAIDLQRKYEQLVTERAELLSSSS
jgi:hypothetical protein